MDTLSFHKSRPLVAKVDLRSVPLPKIAPKVRHAVELKELEYPEASALRFYSMNHLWGLVQLRFDNLEPLAEANAIAESYHELIYPEAVRLYYYLLLITTRESRHAKSGGSLEMIYSHYPSHLVEFHRKHVKDQGSQQAVDSMMNNAPSVTLGMYTDWLVEIFNKGSYAGGFGGKKWGEIAQVLRDFVYGEISAEMMLDTGFTLAHNNGPIFNKGMLYHTYNASEIQRILDTQASGQVPNMVVHADSKFVDESLRQRVLLLKDALGEQFGPVDWVKVTENSKNGHHYSPAVFAPPKPKFNSKKHFQVASGVVVDKLTRQEMAA